MSQFLSVIIVILLLAYTLQEEGTACAVLLCIPTLHRVLSQKSLILNECPQELLSSGESDFLPIVNQNGDQKAMPTTVSLSGALE